MVNGGNNKMTGNNKFGESLFIKKGVEPRDSALFIWVFNSEFIVILQKNRNKSFVVFGIYCNFAKEIFV